MQNPLYEMGFTAALVAAFFPISYVGFRRLLRLSPSEAKHEASKLALCNLVVIPSGYIFALHWWQSNQIPSMILLPFGIALFFQFIVPLLAPYLSRSKQEKAQLEMDSSLMVAHWDRFSRNASLVGLVCVGIGYTQIILLS